MSDALRQIIVTTTYPLFSLKWGGMGWGGVYADISPTFVGHRGFFSGRPSAQVNHISEQVWKKKLE